MLLSDEELSDFFNNGLLLKSGCLNSNVMSVIDGKVNLLQGVNTETRVLERDGRTIRALHGCNQHDDFLDRLVRLPQLLQPAMQILNSEIYLYQFKINIKAPFRGDVWPWHQDYIFWRNEDGMPKPRAVNVLIFVDDVTEFNAPMYFMPGSHREGTIESSAGQPMSEDDWHANVSADLKYGIDDDRLSMLALAYGLTAPKGPTGTILFFDSNIVHGSPSNISPFQRRVIIITYNAIDNVQRPGKRARPEFLVGRDYRALTPLPEDIVRDMMRGAA